ncbi:MAG: PA-phosphatase [Pedosphaera sp.]|nr:PA-phosphatase [Pedosphaera sp.]
MSFPEQGISPDMSYSEPCIQADRPKSRASLPTRLFSRIIAHWERKLLLTLALNLFFWVGYAWLGHHAVFPLRNVPATWLDTLIQFSPQPWGWIYLSQFLYTGTLPWLINSKPGLRRYVVGLLWMCSISFLAFLFFPTVGPRVEYHGQNFAVALIQHYDGALNAFPSLHAAFLVYTFALGWRLFPGRIPPSFIGVCLLWAGLILYSTLATKQHYTLDLMAGCLLGFGADRLAWGNFAGCKEARTMSRSSGSASQAGII